MTTTKTKIQLTIKTSYLPKWHIWEGIRELVQNARDAEVEHHARMDIRHGGDMLRIENKGTTLPLKALLLGHTTKLGNEATIGQFGEGLKLGILALVRAGISVKIRNGDEVWTPVIEHSPVFDEDVLAFEIEGGRKYQERVLVEVACSKKAWDDVRDRLLFVRKPRKSEQITSRYGSLLLGDRYKGRVYVKGIFVSHHDDLQFGYDLAFANLDRDRKMVEHWNLRTMTRTVLLQALGKSPKLRAGAFEIFETKSPETDGLEYSLDSLDDATAALVADTFAAKHGKDAVPVASLAESADIEHLGKRGVVVPDSLRKVLEKTVGSLESVKEELRTEVTKTYSWHELSDAQKTNLVDGIELVDSVVGLKLEDVVVVDFRSDDLMGQFADGRMVLIAAKHLDNAATTLEILVHETAHRDGSDGDKSHVAKIEHIWSGIVSIMRTRLTCAGLKGLIG